MGTFAASLRALGDVQGIPATVELEDGVLSIAAGETSIGEWEIDDLRFESIPNGYRIAAEGDQILLELKDLDGFNEQLNAKRSRFKRKKKGVKEKARELDVDVSAPDEPVAPKSPIRVEPRPVSEPKTATADRAEKPAKPASDSTGFGAKVLNFVDNTLEKASDRLGPYLPEWLFTRFMFGIVFGAVIVALVLPGYVSVFLLLAGALIIVFGAVIYSDPMLASRWLPGRTTPSHVLMFGMAILLLGVLLGVIAG